MAPGTCGDAPMPMGGSGGMGGMGGVGGEDGGAGDDGGAGEAGSAGAAGSGGAAGSDETAFDTLGGGGCDCRTAPGHSRGTDPLLILSALALLWQRRRRR